MKTNKCFSALAAVVLTGALSAGVGWAQAVPSSSPAAALMITGENGVSRSLSLDDLQRLPAVECKVKDANGTESVYKGASLVELLRLIGISFEPGVMPPRGTAAMYVVAEGTDGYKAVFALGEIDSTPSTAAPIMAAYQKDGKPLPEREGPVRMVAPQDKRPMRWVRQLTSLSLHKS